MDQVKKLQTTCLRPSQAQLALAIAIVNSKPAAIPVLDHINQIRFHVKQSTAQPLSLDAYKYFDSVAHWRQAYYKAEDEQSKLSNRVFELEQRVESLKLKLKDDDIKLTPESGKRKDGCDSGASGPRKKRQKNGPEIGVELESLDDIMSHMSSKEGSIGSLMRHLSTLQQNINKKPNWAVISAEMTLSSVNSNEASVPNLPKQKAILTTEPNSISILAVIESAHKILCQSINKMNNSAEGRKFDGQVTYHIVSLFETALQALEKQCQLQVTQNDKPKNKPLPKRRGTKISEAKSQGAFEINSNISFDDISRYIRHLLAGMMLRSTTLITKYESIFEGYLFVFLRRVGTLVSIMEFREMLSDPELQASPDQLPIPGGLSRAKTDDISLRAAEIESKHIVWLLEKVVALVHSVGMKSTRTLTDGPSAEAPGSNESLLRFTKKRMQRTLLKTVFSEDDPLFLDSLKQPQATSSEPTHMDESESASEWFSRQLWKYLGSDVLESVWK
ncbi:hypothetical protein BGW36DRAFT_397804 [Talaromyces proteolyticus]|uniref:Uncharacterized protein n=1 Tax=Talaromyces proteolyticus TaxID=1131652 RepID=A0AAD4PZP2_9EURO|nr:uncharacterized protein BGW36DRAFT_397804 [Talaromyces proteolyticus]KAH8696186.1 hypothetical protein BGW36DRAFT_397804 [Talaromyces proteolyticus]